MNYDAIIIGSGIGGLTTAAFLTRAGKKILILERHNVPGGFAHTFKRKGYEWDVGVHYVGHMCDPKKHIMRKVMDYLTDGKLHWASMGEIYDHVQIGSESYDFFAGYERQRAQLLARFPDEAKAIHKYFKLVRGLPLRSGLFFSARFMPAWLSRSLGRVMGWAFARRARHTTFDVLSRLTTNRKLIAVLSAQYGDYGLPPKRGSFAVHASLAEHYLNGGCYPVGGARAIYETLLDGIMSRGGELMLKAEVAEILCENGRAIGVQLTNGERILAPTVISNTGARTTFSRLWPKQVPVPEKIKKDLQEIQPSLGHVCLYVGLNASAEDLKLPKYNIRLYDDYDFDASFERRLEQPMLASPSIYISFPSARDPSWAARYPNKSTAQVIVPCPYAWVENWQDKPWMKRAEEYLEFKQAWQEMLLEKLYQVAPQVKGFVDHCEISTPLSTQHFSNHARGEIYGLEHTPRRMRACWLRAATPLRGLYLTGQDLVMVGLGSTLFSGVVTAVAVLKRNVLRPVMHGARGL